MKVDRTLIQRFDAQLDPLHPELSPTAADVVGYGEISAIFVIAAQPGVVHKRLPLFDGEPAARDYISRYREYCRLLAQAGLGLPPDDACVVHAPGRPFTVYISQQQFRAEDFCHAVIQKCSAEEAVRVFGAVAAEIGKIWAFSAANRPRHELALDGQLSNWVWRQGAAGNPPVYVDTGTPLFRKDGVEQLDPELFLRSAPWFLRWVLRCFFLADVMNRYYDQRQVCIDLVANLFKEQRPDLVPPALATINRSLPSAFKPVTAAEIAAYYRQDKLIWRLFLAFRRFDRWITTALLRRRYEFILPGSIKR